MMPSEIQKANTTLQKYARTQEAIAKIKLAQNDPRDLIAEEFEFIVITLVKYSSHVLNDLIECLQCELDLMEADEDE